MTHIPETQQRVKFYQTGTFTVGNRLLDDAQRTVQASVERCNSLDSGHRACQGCGEALGARYAVDAAMRAAGGKVIAANATTHPGRCFFDPYSAATCGRSAPRGRSAAMPKRTLGQSRGSESSGRRSQFHPQLVA